VKLKDDLLLIVNQCRRLALGALLAGLPTIYFLSGFYSVGAEERGVVTRFGRVVQDNVPPGMHYHLPWPLESAEALTVTTLRSIDIDLTASALQALQPELTTGDEDLVDVSLQIQYNVSDPARFINSTLSPEAVLRRIVVAETLYYISTAAIDQLLTTGRTPLQNQLRAKIQAALNDLHLGIRITAVQIVRLEPPLSIKSAFADVSRALSEKQRLIQESIGKRSTRLAQARSEANRTVQQAHAYAAEVLAQAQGSHEHFMVGWQEYRKSPEVAQHRLWLESLERILAQTQVTVARGTEGRAPSAPLTPLARTTQDSLVP
jgi:membrane protease subunit HflK